MRLSSVTPSIQLIENLLYRRRLLSQARQLQIIYYTYYLAYLLLATSTNASLTYLRNPRGTGRQVTLDVAVTGFNCRSRDNNDNPDQIPNHRFSEKSRKYDPVAIENGFQSLSAIFSHTGQTHGAMMRFIEDQIRCKLVESYGKASRFKITSTIG